MRFIGMMVIVMIVAFEGVDGSGKSHHSKALRGRLMNDGFSVFCGHCPKGTDIGRFLYSS
jgi:thymidylate kinase